MCLLTGQRSQETQWLTFIMPLVDIWVLDPLETILSLGKAPLPMHTIFVGLSEPPLFPSQEVGKWPGLDPSGTFFRESESWVNRPKVAWCQFIWGSWRYCPLVPAAYIPRGVLPKLLYGRLVPLLPISSFFFLLKSSRVCFTYFQPINPK